MDLVLLLARIALAAVFVVAGVAKLADLPGSRKAVRDFGVPERLAPAFGLLLPIAELMAAAALLPVSTARWGALLALALLLVFIAGIGYNLARGRTPDCHCFGQIHSAPAGWPTIARNAGLAVVALFIGVAGWSDPGYSTIAWLGDLSGTGLALLSGGIVALAMLAGLTWVAVNLIGQNGRLLLRLEAVEAALAAGGATSSGGALSAVPGSTAPANPAAAPLGLPVGTPAPAFSLPDLDGTPVSLATLRAGGLPQLLLFTDPNCGPCNEVMRNVSRWEQACAGRMEITVLSRGSREANLAKRDEHALTSVLIQSNRDLGDAYQVKGTPAAVLVAADGTIGAPTAGGLDAVRGLVSRLAQGETARSAATATAPTVVATPSTVPSVAPAFRLPDLDGRPVALADLLAHRLPVALYFTDPQCDPCDVLLPDLARWQRDYADRITVALVSRGTPEANRAKMQPLGIANVLLQNDMELIEAYGMTQAPAVVIVQPDGTRDGDPAYGDLQIRVLVARVADVPEIRPEPPSPVSDATAERVLRIGDGIPSIELPAIGGELADLANVRGAETVLLFWSPTCGYCLRMLNDLKAWEANRSAGSARLVVISTGTAEMTRAHGFRSPVVLDQGQGIGRRFGTRGTPAAIRIDAQGRVASPVASGATAVLGMLRAGAPAPITPEPTPTAVSANGHGGPSTGART